MKSFANFERKVELGRLGNPVSIPCPFDRLANHLSTTRNQYSLIGGPPGTGKSSYAHQAFALHPYDWIKANQDITDVKLKVFIYSLERAEEFYIAKWICNRIYLKYGILIHPRLVLGMVPKVRMPDGMYNLVAKEKDYFEEMSDTITMVSDVTSVTKVDRDLTKWASENGKYIAVADAISGEPTKEYIPHDPNLITIVIIDHIGRVQRQAGGAKETVDAMSHMLCKHRDRHGFSPVIVCQFNRNIGDINRRKFTNFLPEEQDFKESGNMYEDADAAHALFNPKKFGLDECMGYQLSNFQSESGENRFRLVTVLKNSLGPDLLNVPLNFIGEIGQFKELPRPLDMTAEQYWWASNPARHTMTGKKITYATSSSINMKFTT